MLFLLKTLFYALTSSFILSLPAYTQWREDKSANAPQPTIIPKDSIRKYWVEMFDDRHFIWAGIGVNMTSSQTIRFADELNFVPKYKHYHLI